MKKHDFKKILGNPSDLDALSFREFEELVAAILESFGWQVSLTPATKDGGYDMLAIHQAAPGLEVSWIVECKHYSHPVGVEIVRGLYGVRDSLSIACAALVTTAHFTKGAIDFANNRPIKLIDRAGLLKWVSKAVAAPTVIPPPRFYSVFISYAKEDEEFASRLQNDFLAAGIRCWKWNDDARTGRSLWGEIDRAIRIFDKLVLIASESSLKSPAVNREIERALVQEDEREKCKLAGDLSADGDVLFPVRIDDYLFQGWQHERKVDVTKKIIADARGWDKDAAIYNRVRDRLIRDLKND